MTPAFWRSPLYVLSAATAIVMLSFGIRQTFGLYMAPISADMGWGREVLSFALALQSLTIGLAAPIVGAIADKWGPLRVISASGLVYSGGILLMSDAGSPVAMVLSAGVITGLGVSGCGLSLILSVVGRVAPDDKRSLWLGITTAGATGGQLFIVPAVQSMITGYGWLGGLLIMAGLIALVVPLAASLHSGSAEALSRKTQQSLGEALHEASGHRGYWLLVTGFFVCGFQVQFVTVHLPAFLTDSGAPAALGATAIAVIGVFNMMGTWGAGWLGGRFRKTYLLSLLYTLRSAVILVFIQFPLSQASVLVFAAAIGLLWLSTVPLTSGIVAQVFGTRYMATLFAIVYLSHQVGSFTGVWLGGMIYDATGSYDSFWWVSISLGLVAALLHWPINDRPLARVAERA